MPVDAPGAKRAHVTGDGRERGESLRVIVRSDRTWGDAAPPSTAPAWHYEGESGPANWGRLSTPIELSKEQIGPFTRLIDGNNRPVQPLNGRAVTTGAVTVSAR
jgi:carbonic anhydrase